jgi:hypothetical protein
MYALWIKETCGKAKLISKEIVDFSDLLSRLNKADVDFNIEEIYVRYFESNSELEDFEIPI